MTIKLYEQEPYQTTFHAYVVSCVKKNELYEAYHKRWRNKFGWG